jgi:DNA-binding NtrC family response regulator
VVSAPSPSPAAGRAAAPGGLQAEMKSIERERILAALERCDGNQSEAARQLGMPRRTLVTRLGELGLTRRRRPDGETGPE